ncbi:Tm-1-like ATP-binding domain-containing protein [Pseudopelagicola sp. nBUS_19]|uniref:Tm-1-like ATP-binding domain-containing protein n=1 Tax=Pseudopelagicola sp. nBUS_19 TaxID=3395316 RepID=UPI003EC131AD
MAQVLVLVTMATKAKEAGFLLDQLSAAGVTAKVIDISLNTGGEVLDGAGKCIAMSQVALNATNEVNTALAHGTEVIVGIGGGTGAEIAMQIMRDLPVIFPKVLCTTLPFDPRFAVADNSIILVPTLADISGLNGILREALENTALITAGLCKKARKGELIDIAPSVAITALGATDAAIKPLISALRDQGRESTVFHSNGFGGAAFSCFARRGAFNAIIDLTPHELTRIHLAGDHVAMPDRFSAGGDLPRVVLPGAINFIGLGQKSLMQARYLERPHYEHSALFTHVKVTPDDMELVSRKLAEALNANSGPCAMIVPMGGFSHHDRPGGIIEDPTLRMVCAETLEAKLNGSIPVIRLDAHLFAPEVTEMISRTLAELSA